MVHDVGRVFVHWHQWGILEPISLRPVYRVLATIRYRTCLLLHHIELKVTRLPGTCFCGSVLTTTNQIRWSLPFLGVNLTDCTVLFLYNIKHYMFGRSDLFNIGTSISWLGRLSQPGWRGIKGLIHNPIFSSHTHLQKSILSHTQLRQLKASISSPSFLSLYGYALRRSREWVGNIGGRYVVRLRHGNRVPVFFLKVHALNVLFPVHGFMLMLTPFFYGTDTGLDLSQLLQDSL